jgi:hypothetical protein
VTERAAEQLSPGPPPRRQRVREFVANRSGTQRVGAVAAVLVLATAPFGGLSSAKDADVAELELGQKIDTGPYYVTITRVRQLESLPPVEDGVPGSSLLAIRMTVTNHTDRAEFAELSWNAIGGEHTGVIPWPGDSEPVRHVYDVNDATEVPDGEFINPGQTYDYVIVLRQQTDTDLDRVVLEVSGYDYLDVDPQTLDPKRWVFDDKALARGHVPIEVGEA